MPSGMNRNNAPAMRSLLSRYGVDIDEAANGIPLGHPRPHNFTHRGAFLDRLSTHLDNFERNQLALGSSTTEIGDMLRIELRKVGDQVQSELRLLNLDQLISGTPHPSAYWTA
nr:AHH domain-containing protein [Streptomyces triticirhizae]